MRTARLFSLISFTIFSVTASRMARSQQAPPEPATPPPGATATPPSPPTEPALPATSAPPSPPAAALSPAPAAPLPEVAPGAPQMAEAAPPPAAEPPKKPTSTLAVASEDGANSLELHGLIHADARFFLPRTGIDSFVIRRARPSLDAKLFRYFEVKLQADFAGSRLQLLDAYGNLRFIDEVQLRFGKGKSPVGLERLKSPADIMFAERGFPTLLVPNRDIGVQLHGQLVKGAVEWAGGIYNGVPDGQSGEQDENRQKDYAGRIFARPFLPFGNGPLSGLGLGIAGAIGVQEGALATYRTSGQETFFTPAEIAQADGDRWLVTPQGAYYFGPVALLGEYARVKQRVSDGAEAYTQLDAEAWQVAGSITIGGNQSFQGVKVDHPLDPEKNQWGAFELSARYQSIRFDPRVFDSGFADRSASARLARAYTLGATWHFARRLRALVNYERTTFEAGAPDGQDRDFEGLFVTRLQVAF